MMLVPAQPLTPLSFQILLSLVGQPLHGYGMLKAIEVRMGPMEVPSTGALYLALQRLEKEGLIEPTRERPLGADGRRKYWMLTTAGRESARMEADRMEALLKDVAVRALRQGTDGAGA
jgi:DNA-binding PadR family transcriptional regulator